MILHRLIPVLFLSIPWISADDIQREERTLAVKHNTDDLNIEHIISLWNRSAADETTTAAWTTTPKPITTTVPSTTTEKFKTEQVYKIPDNFPDRLAFCVKKHKAIYKGIPDQAIIVKCLKTEVLAKLHLLLDNPRETIKLFNGYLEFQKIDKVTNDDNETNKNEIPVKKRYSSRVSSKKPLEPTGEQPLVPVALKQTKVSHNHASDYYEAYQKMLKELVARKSGSELNRSKRDEENTSGRTLEKSAKFFEKGRKLFSEISNNLENGEDDVESLTQTILDPDLVSTVNNFTRSYSLRLNFYPGISARMTRNANSGVTFDLELEDISDSSIEDINPVDDGGRGGKKKKKKIISKKTLKKLFPYLLIPFMIQAALLPIVLKFLLFVAIKALIAGKLALILVAFNAIRNASLKSDEDEYVERMSYEHYGYGGGEEYGAWVNRRNINVPEKEEGGSPVEEEVEYAEPYRAYRPENFEGNSRD